MMFYGLMYLEFDDSSILSIVIVYGIEATLSCVFVLLSTSLAAALSSD